MSVQWKVEKGTLVYDQENNLICEVVGYNNEEQSFCSEKTNTEHARLVATAPSMLEKLQKIVEEWRRQRALFPVLEKDGWMDLQIRETELLISKAEGKGE